MNDVSMAVKRWVRDWTRRVKAKIPLVRRRKLQALEHRYHELAEALGWRALPAGQARLVAVKPVVPELDGEVCLFVSFAARPRIKPHVAAHIDQLMRSGIRVVLIVNSDQPDIPLELAEDLRCRLSGIYVRENTGFDFAAWAQVLSLCPDISRWSRLLLVNDSIVGPLDTKPFDRMLARIRGAQADFLGLTENHRPRWHLQSFFLVFNPAVLRHPSFRQFVRGILSLPTKEMVIDVYETRLTQMLSEQGLRGEALFPLARSDLYKSNDTVHRWDQLILAGFPYVKTSVVQLQAEQPAFQALVPPPCRQL